MTGALQFIFLQITTEITTDKDTEILKWRKKSFKNNFFYNDRKISGVRPRGPLQRPSLLSVLSRG